MRGLGNEETHEDVVDSENDDGEGDDWSNPVNMLERSPGKDHNANGE